MKRYLFDLVMGFAYKTSFIPTYHTPVVCVQLKVSVRRKRREFGAPCEFKDRNVADAKDGYIECTSFKDKTFDLQKLELDKGTQVSGARQGYTGEWS